MAGFDERCPYCNHEINCQSVWENHDYATGFKAECVWCMRKVQIDVRMEPIFETSKPCCAMCSKAETGDNPHYCNPCHARLIELSKHNGKFESI
jgi:hypothetical protein